MKNLNWHRITTITMLLAASLVGCGTTIEGGGSGGGGNGGSGGSGGNGGGTTSGGNGTDCVPGGCSGQLCVEPGDGTVSTCEWRDEYACYKQVGICERDANNQCGWRQTQELQDCIDAANNPPPDMCMRNSQDACTTDADCKTGGCGGELCEGIGSSGVTDCNCTTPQGVTCGCVNGTCGWRP